MKVATRFLNILRSRRFDYFEEDKRIVDLETNLLVGVLIILRVRG